MGNILLNNSIITSFDKKDRNLICSCCAAMDIDYLWDNDSILLFPSLAKKNVVLLVADNCKATIAFAEELGAAIANQGANVLQSDQLSKHVTKYINTEVLVGFFDLPNNDTEISIYLPPRNNLHSQALASGLAKEILAIGSELSYQLIPFWKGLGFIRHQKFFNLGAKASLILGIKGEAFSKTQWELLQQALLLSIIGEVDIRVPSEELGLAIGLLQKIERLKLQDELQATLARKNQKIEQLTSRLNELQKKTVAINQSELKRKQQKVKKSKKNTASQKLYPYQLNSLSHEIPKPNRYQTYPIKYPEGSTVFEFKRPPFGIEQSLLPPTINPSPPLNPNTQVCNRSQAPHESLEKLLEKAKNPSRAIEDK